ncbi:MAG TPA: F0F1 ATP synthase subunit gamma [Agriterribacter sp.]|nr:F0F1 ATP synthase subunit gamma [Agriterribacter sp.]
MGDTLESLQRRKESAADLDSVVRTMKAMAASNISWYEMAVKSLQDYYKTVSLGIYAFFAQNPAVHHRLFNVNTEYAQKSHQVISIVFGSDQGLVGRFNDSLASYVEDTLQKITGKKEAWLVGERMYPVLIDDGFTVEKVFAVPHSMDGITSLVNDVLAKIEDALEQKQLHTLYIFYNGPQPGSGYSPRSIQLLPLDESWQQKIVVNNWPTKSPPQVIGDTEKILQALIREYVFVSIYKACAESLASENASRLEAMQRAEKNIGEMLEEIKQTYNRLRQSSIDEELFDVISGFEALKKK